MRFHVASLNIAVILIIIVGLQDPIVLIAIPVGLVAS
jgi:hypothetical protein